MKQEYWDRLADTFDEDVFDPVASDQDGVILKTLEAIQGKTAVGLDIGCGTGRNIPLLATKFASVTGLDLSQKCLEIARRRHVRLKNVDFQQVDLAKAISLPNKADLGLCLNVVMMPSYEIRQRILDNVFSMIRPNGHILLLVPALESALLTINRLITWNMDEYPNYRQAAAAANEELGFTACSLRDGLINKGGTATKHYLREELQLIFAQRGQEVCDILKVEYTWDTEFDAPPTSMSAPFPWDWLVVLKVR